MSHRLIDAANEMVRTVKCGTWVWRDGALVEKHLARPLFERGPSSTAVPVPAVISDKLSDVIGQHNGQVYDSKSALRRSYKEGGYVELGNDAPLETGSRRPEVHDDVVAARKAWSDGYRPAPLEHGVVPEDD